MSSHAKFSLGSILILFLILSPLAVQAQASMSKTNAVTGCLQKGAEAGGFLLPVKTARFWELSGKVDATHVGHKVTVSGHVLHRSKTEKQNSPTPKSRNPRQAVCRFSSHQLENGQ